MPDSLVPHITYLRIRNYRALRDVEFRDLTPLTVLIGANGSGKSTVLDALVFFGEWLRGRLQEAWESRNGVQGLVSRDGSSPEPVSVTVGTPALKNLRVVESPTGMATEVSEEVTADDDFFMDDDDSPGDHRPLVDIFRYVRRIDLTAIDNSGLPDSVFQRRLSPSGDNLPNVLFYLSKKHPALLEELLAELRRRVPRLESITAEETIDKRLVLRLKDAPFAEPIPARFASDGTLRLLAYLVLLNEPEPAGLLGVEEPEAGIHPSLHGRLAEDFIRASARTQLFVATHSPQFLNALEPEQVWVLDRTADGYTRATRAADIMGVKEMMNNGGALGDLWMEGYLNPDDRRPAPDAR